MPCCCFLYHLLPPSPQKPSNLVPFLTINVPTLNPPTMSSEADKSPMTVPFETSTTPKPTLIGIYGLPGSGKSTVLGRLKNSLPSDVFTIYEDSEIIASLMGSERGLDDFHALSEEEKTQYRERGVIQIREECQSMGRTGVVAGHYMFWSRDSEEETVVWTKADQDTFIHIIYLQMPAEILCRRRQLDDAKKREAVTPIHLHEWQETEMQQLGNIAKGSRISFVVLEFWKISSDAQLLDRDLPNMLYEVCAVSQQCNHARVLATVDQIVAHVRARGGTKVTTALVFDADKTLIAQDTGKEFWRHVSSRMREISQRTSTPVEEIFDKCGYIYDAFLRAAMAYSGVKDFEEICNSVAERVTLYPEFLSLLRCVKQHEHMMAVLVTCGLRRLWEIVMDEIT